MDATRWGGLSELSANSTRAARIGELLCTYPDDVQRIVRLRVYAERPFGEIAEIVHMPEAAVKARYYRAVRAVRSQIEREEHLREVEVR